MVQPGSILRGDGDCISSPTISSSENDFSRPTSTFPGFKSEGDIMSVVEQPWRWSNRGGGATVEAEHTCMSQYHLTFIMEVDQSSEEELDGIFKKIK